MRTFALVLALVATPSAAEPLGSLEVNVSGLHGSVGQIGCALFGAERGFPRETARALQRMLVAIGQKCLFKGVPAGTYAVAVFHDRDGSGRISTNLLGIPTEGYGVSNNHTYALSSPKFSESRFVINQGEYKSLVINLRY